MTRQAIIERTIKALNQLPEDKKALNQLPEDKAEEISDFVDFVSKRYEEQQLVQGIQSLTSNSAAFQFLNDEEEIYSVADLKQVYNG